MKKFDVIIVGGGMIGLSLVVELSKKMNLSVAIIDPNDCNPTISDSFHTRVSAITPSTQDFLSSINVWDKIQRKKGFSATKVWDQNSHGHLNFYAKDEGIEYLGYIVENDLIQSALFNAIDQSKVSMINAKLVGFTKTDIGYTVNLENGESHSCKLLVGADGSQSKVRDLAEIQVTEHDYQQKAIIANIVSEKPLMNTTWQRFLSDSILAILPLSNHQASIVWSCKEALANELEAKDKTIFNKMLSEASEYQFGVLELESSKKSFPLVSRTAKEYVRANLALIGDAAHNIHPLAGQGANLGFSDVIELSKQLVENNDKLLGDFHVLRKYARARRLDNEMMSKTMTGLDWIYKENNEPIRWLRGYGMNLIDETPILKSFFQRQALGKVSKK
ncbi:MAG: UbiH/UbiF/VisC/COQ6 family ubiquinone biosynthesis hydroxylase [Thiotrichales bacterium]|nr:UbiH/UbiF/VisC/COQ6 family ubiquinone biosynthesis hydroxylase [Thiotrichales bacterium]MBT5984726.1 UbiH/UbiF/VisC/COQ6 family ubiquinone biosynthesis hydroxylase [Thiotrichales bacterium]MBT6771612.1 UbiH/UbiF/VisC/COQ6 family ubiquinone biosynthesis hydroxylase [Thiotrichales bacterium]